MSAESQPDVPVVKETVKEFIEQRIEYYQLLMHYNDEVSFMWSNLDLSSKSRRLYLLELFMERKEELLQEWESGFVENNPPSVMHSRTYTYIYSPEAHDGYVRNCCEQRAKRAKLFAMKDDLISIGYGLLNPDDERTLETVSRWMKMDKWELGMLERGEFFTMHRPFSFEIKYATLEPDVRAIVTGPVPRTNVVGDSGVGEQLVDRNIVRDEDVIPNLVVKSIGEEEVVVVGPYKVLIDAQGRRMCHPMMEYFQFDPSQTFEQYIARYGDSNTESSFTSRSEDSTQMDVSLKESSFNLIRRRVDELVRRMKNDKMRPDTDDDDMYQDLYSIRTEGSLSGDVGPSTSNAKSPFRPSIQAVPVNVPLVGENQYPSPYKMRRVETCRTPSPPSDSDSVRLRKSYEVSRLEVVQCSSDDSTKSDEFVDNLKGYAARNYAYGYRRRSIALTANCFNWERLFVNFVNTHGMTKIRKHQAIAIATRLQRRLTEFFEGEEEPNVAHIQYMNELNPKVLVREEAHAFSFMMELLNVDHAVEIVHGLMDFLIRSKEEARVEEELREAREAAEDEEGDDMDAEPME